MKTGNDAVARGSDKVAAGDGQSADLSSQVWTSMRLESRGPQQASSSTNSEARSAVIDFDVPKPNAGLAVRQSNTLIGFSSKPDHGSASVERVPPNTASDSGSGSAERIQPGDNKPRPNVGGDIRPNSMVDNQTLINRFDKQSSDVRTSQLESPSVTLLSPQFHQQFQRLINDADNLPFKRIEAERANTQSALNNLNESMSISEQRMLEESRRDPELQEMIPRMLQDVDNPRFHGMHDMNRLRQIAPDLADAMERRIESGRRADELERQIDHADTLAEKPTSARFDYATNLIDSGLPENRDRAVQVLTELLNNNPDAARYRAPGSSGNRSMAELILRSNALDNKGFAAAFARAGGNPNTLQQQWQEDQWSFIERRGR